MNFDNKMSLYGLRGMSYNAINIVISASRYSNDCGGDRHAHFLPRPTARRVIAAKEGSNSSKSSKLLPNITATHHEPSQSVVLRSHINS